VLFDIHMTKSANAEDAQGLVLPWPALSIALLTLTLGSLGTLAVVVSVKDADILSTVALALAVLAFAAQLIVTLAQGQQASQLNADMKESLSAMRSTTGALLTNQREQFDRVLQAALRQAIPAALEDLGDASDGDDDEAGQDDTDLMEELEQRISFRLTEALEASAATDVKPPSAPTKRERREKDERFAELMRSAPEPSAEREEAASLLDSMSPRQVASWSKVATTLRGQAPPDRTLRFVQSEKGPSSNFRRFVELGLMEQVSGPPSGERGSVTYKVLPLGELVSRLLLNEETGSIGNHRS